MNREDAFKIMVCACLVALALCVARVNQKLGDLDAGAGRMEEPINVAIPSGPVPHRVEIVPLTDDEIRALPNWWGKK